MTAHPSDPAGPQAGSAATGNLSPVSLDFVERTWQVYTGWWPMI